MEVILNQDAENSLKEYFYNIAINEFNRARNDIGLDRPLNQQEIADFFSVSTTTIRRWETLGMPYGSMGERSKYYDRIECKKWVLSQKN